jgi:hypothetical protein
MSKKKGLTGRAATVEKTGKSAVRGAEFYVLRTSAGQTLKVKTTASSTASMDKTLERFSEAMKRLAKR